MIFYSLLDCLNEFKYTANKNSWTDLDNKTGCTAIISDLPLVASIDVRGGAPGTKEIALLDPIASAPNINDNANRRKCICLNASAGVVSYLEEQNIE